MTIDFLTTSTCTGLFDILGKVFYAQGVVNTARGTTVPTEIDDILECVANLTIDSEITQAAAGIGGSSEQAKTTMGGVLAQLQAFARQYLIEVVHDDNPLPSKTLELAMQELIDQMIANSESVDASAVGATVTADGSNTGSGVVVVSTKRGDGLVNENIIAEDIEVEATSNGPSASLRCRGEASTGGLDAEWPKGSGSGRSITSTSAGSGLVLNGDMEDEDDADNAPDDWIVSVGTVGTTLKMTDVEVQTLTVTGTPTTGWYTVSWQNAAGVTQTTEPLAYNASAATLQAALRKLTGLSQVTVTATGTSPNFTHTITFVGVGGNVAQITASENTDSGTYTPGTSSAGTGKVHRGGKAVEFDSNGSELTTLNSRIAGLQPETSYAVNLWAICDSVPAAGVFTVDLVDGIGGTVIQDSEGTNNSATFNAADVSDSAWKDLKTLVGSTVAFRTPLVVPPVVYLRVRISTAVSATSSIYVDDVAMVRMVELYAGGPLVAAFDGSTAFVKGDKWTIATTNDGAGLLQRWFERNFNMGSLGMLLPSDSGGTETIPDSVVG